jgi:hypothetical protein
MRQVRKLLLLAVMAMAAMALAAPSAFAQITTETEPPAVPASTGLTITAEPAGTACTAVSPATPPATGNFTTSGGCVVHGGGQNIQLIGHPFGIPVIDSTCNVEFDLRTDGQGRGYLVHQEFTQGTQGTCSRRPCNQPIPAPPAEEPPVTNQGEGRPWRGYARETAVDTTEISVLFCVENRHSATTRTNVRHCGVNIPFVESPTHRYTFTANDVAGTTNASGIRCEVNGVFTTESTQVSPSGENQTRTQVEVAHTTPGVHP